MHTKSIIPRSFLVTGLPIVPYLWIFQLAIVRHLIFFCKQYLPLSRLPPRAAAGRAGPRPPALLLPPPPLRAVALRGCLHRLRVRPRVRRRGVRGRDPLRQQEASGSSLQATLPPQLLTGRRGATRPPSRPHTRQVTLVYALDTRLYCLH